MQRLIGLIVGLILLGIFVVVPVILFGGALISAIVAVLAIPLAFPLTLGGIIILIGVYFAWTAIKGRIR